MNEKIHAFDFARMLIGRANALFLVEALARLLFLYAVLVVAMRLMGRRMSSQLSRNELLAMVSLAAAIGPAVQDPARGILPPLIVAILVVLFQRTVARHMAKSGRFESIANGTGETLVRDGRLILPALRRSAVSRERVFAELRGSGMTQLGQVERLYMEAGGSFSTVRRDDEQPGLTVLPSFDAELIARQRRHEDVPVCVVCGAPAQQDVQCPHCAARESTTAVTSAA